MKPPPFPLSSRAQSRDLRFNGPVVEMFSTDRTRRGYDPKKTMGTYEIEPAEKAKPLFGVSISNRDAALSVRCRRF
jgi:hypothetical protein